MAENLDLDFNRCSRCKKKFADLIISVSLEIQTFRVDSKKSEEELYLLNKTPREYLCEECFGLFSDKLSEMNMEKEEVFRKEEILIENENRSNEYECCNVIEDVTYDD